jgi:hypothetical protein
MIGNGWKLTASDLSTLAEDKPMLDKVTGVIELSEDELGMITGGWGGYGGYSGYGYFGHRHHRHHRHHHHHW